MSHFRLPTKEELETLIHPGRDRDLFRESGWLWSSSLYNHDNNLNWFAWYVNFSLGNVNWGDRHDVKQVRLVRADSALTIDDSVNEDDPDRLQDNGDGTHIDRRTALIWRSQPEDGVFTWDEAMAAFPEHSASRPAPVPPMELDWSALGPPIQWGVIG